MTAGTIESKSIQGTVSKSITRIKYPDEKQNGGQISARRCCSHNDTINPRP